MLPISAIAPIFAKLDGNEDETASVEKALRNFVQRFPLPPSARDGRVFLYDRPAIVAMRLGYTAHMFGLDRGLLHRYVTFLCGAAEKAVRYCKAGEDFAFHVAARPIGEDIWATWDEPKDDAELSRAERAIWFERRNAIELGRFTQGAGLVAQISKALPPSEAEG